MGGLLCGRTERQVGKIVKVEALSFRGREAEPGTHKRQRRRKFATRATRMRRVYGFRVRAFRAPRNDGRGSPGPANLVHDRLCGPRGSAAAGSGATRRGGPPPARSRRRASTMRFWSPASAPAGRMPGVTISRSEPTRARTAAASVAAQTMPSMPISRACAARRATSSAVLEGVAGLREVGVVVGGQHRDGEDLEVRAGLLPRPPPAWSADRRARSGTWRRAAPRSGRPPRPCWRCRGA